MSGHEQTQIDSVDWRKMCTYPKALLLHLFNVKRQNVYQKELESLARQTATIYR